MSNMNAHVIELRNVLSVEISDTYKELYGFRPRGYDYMNDPVTSLMETADRLLSYYDALFEERKASRKAEEIRYAKVLSEVNRIPHNSSLGDALKQALQKEI